MQGRNLCICASTCKEGCGEDVLTLVLTVLGHRWLEIGTKRLNELFDNRFLEMMYLGLYYTRWNMGRARMITVAVISRHGKAW